MREQALALRRTLFERANAEMYEVGLGAELSRLLPLEAAAEAHRLLEDGHVTGKVVLEIP